VVGVRVRVDDVADAESCLVGRTDVRVRVADRVHHRAGRLAAAAEEVRGSNCGIDVEKLTQDHERNQSPAVTGRPLARQSGSPSSARRAL
jgi:hypothetical protein